ncbi:hypothetical protein HTSR_0941 [Halodesulfurarchaeum formicicum]|uniref:Uncharacterized protein n=1 Tax=Halodesulfurarchaeum formicicum TaxID=1873524 RepID=A0A1D8S438_9EURY|nr:hypothetical protein [Halodesulfurarchaeum formicicum]AOW80126.1 hypothetical protein HTSR_0941 [Halodesulfurarchaeum formicicum]
MKGNTNKFRSLVLAMLVAGSVLAGTIAFAGGAAAVSGNVASDTVAGDETVNINISYNSSITDAANQSVGYELIDASGNVLVSNSYTPTEGGSETISKQAQFDLGIRVNDSMEVTLNVTESTTGIVESATMSVAETSEASATYSDVDGSMDAVMDISIASDASSGDSITIAAEAESGETHYRTVDFSDTSGAGSTWTTGLYLDRGLELPYDEKTNLSVDVYSSTGSAVTSLSQSTIDRSISTGIDTITAHGDERMVVDFSIPSTMTSDESVTLIPTQNGDTVTEVTVGVNATESENYSVEIPREKIGTDQIELENSEAYGLMMVGSQPGIVESSTVDARTELDVETVEIRNITVDSNEGLVAGVHTNASNSVIDIQGMYPGEDPLAGGTYGGYASVTEKYPAEGNLLSEIPEGENRTVEIRISAHDPGSVENISIDKTEPGAGAVLPDTGTDTMILAGLGILIGLGLIGLSLRE